LSTPALVKMSELARLSGVPAPTIKHYLNEGLVAAAHKTGRNMAYYDAAIVPRIQRIKELQRTRFLPLRVIKEVLDDAEQTPDETASAAIARVLAHASPGERRTRAQLEKGGLRAEDLALLSSLGAVRAEKDGDDEVYAGDDLEILRVLGAARRVGITPEMLPIEILGEYLEALRALVRAEMRLFREGVLPRAGKDLTEITEAATTLSERLVVLVRRKLLLPTLAAARDRGAPPPRARPRRATSRPKR
jgi:DNA-binding transcriptional MerR regulator